MITERPVPTFIYLPVYLKVPKTEQRKYVCSAVFKCFQSFRVGDTFIVDKRPANYEEQGKLKRYKAVKVEYGLFGCGNGKNTESLVELEPINFEDEKQIAAFMSGKNKL